MTTYARVVDGTVFETFTPPEGLDIADCFHKDIAAQFVAVPDGARVAQFWRYDGRTFTAPP